MPTRFFTNKENNSLHKKFKGIFENMHDIAYFDALVGYFRASGYFRIRELIKDVPQIRILVGINVDEIISKYHAKGFKFLGDETKTKEEFINELKNDIEIADYQKETEDSILQFVEDIVNKKILIKAHPTKKLHAKIYIFRPEKFNEHSSGQVITGSSNLTDAGLGEAKESNYEFNVNLRDYDDVKFATEEFEELWKEATDILSVDLERLKKETHLSTDFTPFELYIKLLIEYFGKRIDYDPSSTDLLLPEKYMPLAYQGEAAIEGYEMMMKHNGFFLSDVVGLGKTIVACIIAKKFIYENGHHTRVLVVHPPALKANWKETVNDFGINSNFAFVTTGRLKNILDRENHDFEPPDAFDLVIVDEAHKFRNDTAAMYEFLQAICKTPRRFHGANQDRRKKVMLLSATPMNNSPADIKNQLFLFQDKRNSTLPKVNNLQDFFKRIEDNYDKITKEIKALPAEAYPAMVKKLQELKVIFEEVRYNVIEPIVIRRTRNDILNNPDYKKDIDKQGIKFPDIEPPKEQKYEFDDDLSQLFFDTVSVLTRIDEDGNDIHGLQYYRYRAIEYLTDKKLAKDLYGDVSGISQRLAGIMKTLLIKRLESSFYAFRKSLGRFQKATQNMIEMFENDKVFVAPDIDVNKFLEEKSEEELEDKINEKGGRNRIFETDDFEEHFIELLKLDKKLIDELVTRWDNIGDYDPKLDKFLLELKKTFLKKSINKNNKLVVFSESKETTDYLSDNLNKSGYKKVLAVNADNRKNRETAIKENFDANYKKEHKDDYNIILTTEVLAEGINLHRSNVIVNYDVPWNSTRLMQRIGRVNRIGTNAEKVFVYNFYPTDNSENKIKLSATAIRKLQAFHTAFGEDSQIYSRLEEMGEAGLYGSKLKEERNETLQYLQELRDFKRDKPDWFKEIKRIPKRARIVRDVKNVAETERPLKNGTITYLKTDYHPGVFYLIAENNELIELNFTEAASIYKTDDKEEAIKEITKQHYDQVNFATDKFTEAQQQQAVKKVEKRQLSPAEKRVIGKIQTMQKIQELEKADSDMLKATEKAILAGSHRQLPNDIDKYFKKHSPKPKVDYVRQMIDVLLKPYSLLFTQLENDEPQEHKAVQKPIIIISETFK